MLGSAGILWLVLLSASVLLAPLIAVAYGPPRLRQLGNDIRKVASKGSDVILPCPVRADPTSLFLEWFKGQETLSGVGKYRLTASGSLRIRKVTTEDTGDYVCRAVNGFGSVRIQVFLQVIDQEDLYDGNTNATEGVEGFAEIAESGGPPRFTFVTSFNGSVIQRSAGGTVRLKCAGTGQPGPKVFWLRNGFRLKTLVPAPTVAAITVANATDIYNSTQFPKATAPASSLNTRIVRKRWSIQLERLRPSDSGNYTCVLKNPYGSVSTSFLLEVIDGTKPEVTGYHPLNTTVEYGASATFQCRVRSEISPHIRWLKRVDSNELPRGKQSGNKGQQRIIRVQGEYYRFLKSSQVVSRPDGSFMNKLLIREAREADSGKYICLGANSLGYSYRSAFLTVLHRGPHPGILNWERTVILRPGQPDAVMIGIPITVGVLVGVVVALAILCHSRRGGATGQRSHTADSSNKEECPTLKSVEQQTSFSSFPPPHLQPNFAAGTTTESESLGLLTYPSSVCESTTVSSYRPHFFHSEVVYQEKSVVAKLHECSPKDQYDCFFLRDNV